ncbi:protein kinase domain-containing protein [Ditylenchus destructor]|nr:protein kinase domain-containing protein [Ditylenchus destructor]
MAVPGAITTSPTDRQNLSDLSSGDFLQQKLKANRISNTSSPTSSPRSDSTCSPRVVRDDFLNQLDPGPPPQRSKSTCAAYSPYLKVLFENTEEQQFTPQRLENNRTSRIESDELYETRDENCATAAEEASNNNCFVDKHNNLDKYLDGGEDMVESRRYHHQEMDSSNSNKNEANQGTPNEKTRLKNGFKSAQISLEKDSQNGDHLSKKLTNGSSGTLTHDSGSQNQQLKKLCNGIVKDNDSSADSAAKRRWLITMEPINSLFMECILGAKGRIFRTDDSLAAILGYNSTSLLFGTEIHRLIPGLSIGVEWSGVKQMVCGTTVKHNGIPLSVVLHSDYDHDSGVASSHGLEIRSLSSINGVITVTDSGILYSYNENFLHELVGHDYHSDEEMDIKDLIPQFYEYFGQSYKVHQNGDNSDSIQKFGQQFDDGYNAGSSAESSTSSTTTTARSHTSSISASSTSTSLCSSHNSAEDDSVTSSKPIVDFQVNCPMTNDERVDSQSATLKDEVFAGEHQDIIPGVYFGLVKHIDGQKIPVKIEVTSVEIPSQPRLFNICVGFDRTNDYGINQCVGVCEEHEHGHVMQRSPSNHGPIHPATSVIGGLSKIARYPAMAFSASSNCCSAEAPAGNTITPKFSVGGTFGALRECDSDSAVDFIATKAMAEELQSSEVILQDASVSSTGLLEDENSDGVRGEYSRHYDTFQQIGNGAFGSVKLSARKDTGLLAVTKFVCKAKVLPESWVPSMKRGNRMLPIEVHLLETLNHPNIVKVLDVFENERYYQLVMEKLGCGMDLFEFIDNLHIKLDEPLTSYIFRQIVSAVDYLHENHIVHRDLKDENVIIDQNFHCKLIDFGSAAYFGENIVFSTFCGTMEYCAPEVLTGNKYHGPELEMWSLGILLYTLVFFQNPFRSAQETVRAEFEIPCRISEGLNQVLSFLLLPDPHSRATIAEIKLHWWVTQKVDPKHYSFKDILKNCDRAQVAPPMYVSDLQNQLKNVASCGANLANVSINAIETPSQESGVVSAR